MECDVVEEPWDWDFCENPLKFGGDRVKIREAEQRERGCLDPM